VLAIAQAGQQFHYISWTPTTTKPVLNGYGIKSYEKTDLSSVDFFYSLFSELIDQYKIKIPRIHISLDMDSVHLSETQIPQQSEFESYHNWLIKNNYDSEFSKRFETFYYPFANEISKSLNVHFPLQIKRAIVSAVKKKNAELRFLSLGIFSAESCIRTFYKSEKLNSYLIWRIGQYNFNEIIWVKNNQLVCFIRFKSFNNIFKLQNYYGCSKSTDKILNQLEKCKDNNFDKFNLGNKIFIYSNTNNNTDIKNLMDSGNDKFQIVNIVDKFQNSSDKQNSFIFPETGIAFRGFDV